MATRRQSVFDMVLGIALGGLLGAIVAVNLIITVGIGYDVSLAQVFRENLLVGIVTTLILMSGPIAGIALMRRLRRQREGTTPRGP
jgi:hypothetical protein